MSLDRVEAIAERICELVGSDQEAMCQVTRARHGLTRFANSHIHQHHGEDVTVVRLQIAVGGRVATASAIGLTEEAFPGFVTETVASARLQPIDPDWPGVNGPVEPLQIEKVHASTVEASPRDRAEQVAAFVSAGPALQGAGYLDTGHTEVATATTAGLRVSGHMTRSTLDGIHQTATSAGNAHQTSVAFAEIDGAAGGERAAYLADLGRDGEDLEPGRYEVVLAPECVATIAMFLGVYGFGGQSHNDGQSCVELGSPQFDPAFQLVDAPDDPRVSAVGFDAEGTPRRHLALVEDGVSRAVVHDRRTARRVGTESTGHALHQSPFGPIPGNLIVGGGTTPPDDLIGSVERGVYVSTFNYCRILDPRSQVITGLTRNGTFLIEQGRLSRPITNLRFTQSLTEALAPGAIGGLGDDQRYADSEFGPGFVIAPTLRLSSWNFTGGARG